jgi:diadenosine tetraphosphate (Ap4A) HIT family hydrolase
MAEVYQSKNFIVDAMDAPMITRLDGGHLIINPKVRISDRTKLAPSLAIEFIRLSMIVGEAMQTALNNRGIDVGRINYQDNGNWAVFTPQGPHFHLHLYGRAKSAKIQKYGEACHLPLPHTGFYEGLEPLNAGDIQAIREEIEKLEASEKYALRQWHL